MSFDQYSFRAQPYIGRNLFDQLRSYNEER